MSSAYIKNQMRDWMRVGYNTLSGQKTISRNDFLATIPISQKMLEIGPFTNPCLRGENVYYFDVLNREDLIKRTIIENYQIADCENIPHIHYVSPTGDLSIVPDKFDLAYSCHCIEHQPDLIRHLRDVEKLLHAGGRYFLTIPDKRYCFDALLAESDLGSVIEVFVENRKVHSLANVIRYHALTAHNQALHHWFSKHGKPGGTSGTVSQTKNALHQYKEAEGGYLDVHAWRFTPESFRQIITYLNELKYINMQVERIHPTTFAANEFYAVLKK